MRRIIRVSLFEAYNLVVARVLGQVYGKLNKAVGEKNRIDNYGRKKWLVFHFTRHELWGCIDFIILAVTYGIKVTQLWGTT